MAFYIYYFYFLAKLTIKYNKQKNTLYIYDLIVIMMKMMKMMKIMKMIKMMKIMKMIEMMILSIKHFVGL